MDRNDITHIFDEKITYKYVNSNYAFVIGDFQVGKYLPECEGYESLMREFLNGLKDRCNRSDRYYCIDPDELCDYFDEFSDED